MLRNALALMVRSGSAAARSRAAPLRAFSTASSAGGESGDKGSAEAGKSSGAPGATPGSGSGSGVSAAELAAAKAEADELKKQLQYAYADRENIRRILMRDVKDAKEYGMREFAKDLLDVSDNFERALEASKADAARLPEVKALYDGVFMTEQQLHKVFDRYGIKRMSPIGAKFDPNAHAALLEMHHDEHAEGHVAVVIKSGFHMKDKVLRPAEVGIVRKQPPK
jgi:molecular chaperone GrpE